MDLVLLLLNASVTKYQGTTSGPLAQLGVSAQNKGLERENALLELAN